MTQDPFKEYIRAGEPEARERGYAWQTAIGLQAVDGLQPSQYLIDTAVRHIEGELTQEEVQQLLNSYYEQNRLHEDKTRTEEADKVSARIAALLGEPSFSFTPTEYVAIHRRLFTGIYKHAGKCRDYNITKKEWVLDGATVIYGSAGELKATLEYDLSQEQAYRYQWRSMDEIIRHLAVFVSRLWQIHVFGEGNTRTTAVFFIKYLRTLGFDVTNDIFARNSWYFRNALVRANYTDLRKGIYETTEYLELFLRNLLLGEEHELKNREIHIGNSPEKQDIRLEKRDIDKKKQDIGPNVLPLSSVTGRHYAALKAAFAETSVFGRADVIKVTGLSPSRASVLLKQLRLAGLIVPVAGQGKGKYRINSAL
ncbi:MAG: Fic family protein [Oscillospiraceae bacterium]|nr:Fic family protein [Oscillospiraceae bacterium]